MSVIFTDRRLPDRVVKECGSFRTEPWVIEFTWNEGGDFSRTRSLMKTMVDFANSIPGIHFLCGIGLTPSPSNFGEIWADFSFWAPDEKGPEPGALRKSGGLFVDVGVDDVDDDPFTHIQYAVGQVQDKQKLYRKDGNGAIWFVNDFPDGFQVKTCESSMEVILGKNFLPAGSVAAMEAPTLAKTLAMPGNTAWGYVDWLLYNDPKLEPMLEKKYVGSASSYIALKILRQSGIPCDVDSYDWAKVKGAKIFYDWLIKSIKPWVSDHLGGVPFE
jgi:hypothetical protein